MAERSEFDIRIRGLANFWEALGRLAHGPELSLEEGFIEPDDLTTVWSDWTHRRVSMAFEKGISDTRSNVDQILADFAIREFKDRGFPTKDLRDDNETEQLERAGILALVTNPRSPEDFNDRSLKIVDLFKSIVNGESVLIPSHHDGIFIHYDQVFKADTSRSIHTTGISYQDGGVLRLQYDTGESINADGFSPEEAITIGLTEVFKHGIAVPDDMKARLGIN